MPEFFLSNFNFSAEVLLSLIAKSPFDEIIRFPIPLEEINLKFFQVSDTILAFDISVGLLLLYFWQTVKVVSSQQTLLLTALKYQKEQQNININDELDNEDIWKDNFGTILSHSLNNQREFMYSLAQHQLNNSSTNPTMLVTDDDKVKYFPLNDPKNLCSKVYSKWKTLNRSYNSGTLSNGKSVQFLTFADGDIFSHMLTIQFPNSIAPRVFKIEAVVQDSVNNPKPFPTIQAADLSKCKFSPLKNGTIMIVPIDLTKSGTALNSYSSSDRYTRLSSELQTELTNLNAFFNKFDLFFFPYVSTSNSAVAEERVIILNTSLTDSSIFQTRANDMFPIMSSAQYSSKFKESHYLHGNVAVSFPTPSFSLFDIPYSEGSNIAQAQSESDFYDGTFLTSDRKIIVSKRVPFYHVSTLTKVYDMFGFDLFYRYNSKKVVSKPQTDITPPPFVSLVQGTFVIYNISQILFEHDMLFGIGNKSMIISANTYMNMNDLVTSFNAFFHGIAHAIFINTSRVLFFMKDGTHYNNIAFSFNYAVGNIGIVHQGLVSYREGTNYATPLLPMFDFTLTANVNLTKTFGTNHLLVAQAGENTVDNVVSMINSFNNYLQGLNEDLSWNVKASVQTDDQGNKYIFLENPTESFTVSTEFPLLYEYLGFDANSTSVNIPESITFSNDQNEALTLEELRALP